MHVVLMWIVLLWSYTHPYHLMCYISYSCQIRFTRKKAIVWLSLWQCGNPEQCNALFTNNTVHSASRVNSSYIHRICIWHTVYNNIAHFRSLIIIDSNSGRSENSFMHWRSRLSIPIKYYYVESNPYIESIYHSKEWCDKSRFYEIAGINGRHLQFKAVIIMQGGGFGFSISYVCYGKCPELSSHLAESCLWLE